MKKYAYVKSGIIDKIIFGLPGWANSESKAIENSVLPLEYQSISADPRTNTIVQNPPKYWNIHDTYVEPTYSVTPLDLAVEKEKLRKAIRGIRKRIETAGTYFTYNGQSISVRTDKISQSTINGVKEYINTSSKTEVNWERQPYEWIAVDMTDLDNMGVAVGDHVEATFDRSRNLYQMINDAVDLIELYNVKLEISQGWPINPDLIR